MEHKLSHKGQLSQVYKERLHTFRRKKNVTCFQENFQRRNEEAGGVVPNFTMTFGRKKSHFQLKNEAAQKTRQKTARKRGPNISRPNVLVHSCFTAPSAKGCLKVRISADLKGPVSERPLIGKVLDLP